MRITLKLFAILVLSMLLVLVLGITSLLYLAETRMPRLDGRVSHLSLRAEVSLVRDDWGVPHIAAGNERDAYFTLGYAMAQDRLFQMELARRIARGELAELLGARLAPIDAILRAFQLRTHAAQNLAQMKDGHPETARALEAFVAGVNHSMNRQPLPFEFSVLRIPRRAFTPEDCLAVAALLPLTFADGLRQDVMPGMIQRQHPELDPMLLFPGYSRGLPVTVMEGREGIETLGRMPDTPLHTRAPGSEVPIALLRDLLQPLGGLLGPVLGSNSWVISGERTRSGLPILANDPHIGFTNPGIWYEAHLRYENFESYGYHLPLIPFPLLSHNTDRAWALTMFANDDMDFYQESFHPDDPGLVLYRGEYVAVETVRETIPVRFGSPVTVDIRITPHGPVVTDLLRMLLDYEGPDLALFWVWQHVPYTDILAFHRMGHARGYEDFAEAMPLISSPGLNISYADAEGNIAWWAAGRIPIRPAHVNPKTVLDGASGRDEILGYVPFSENPHLKNPERGFIVTANNLSTVHPVGEAGMLAGYWQPTDRAARIETLLEQRDDWSLEEMKRLQLDVTSDTAPAIVERLVQVVRESGAALSTEEQEAVETLQAWDFRHITDSTGAAIYQVLIDFVLRNALEDELGEWLLLAYGSVADHWNFMKYFIEDPDSPLWNDVRTDAVESREDIVVQSLRDTVAFLRAELGGRPSRWQWGALHTVEHTHPFGHIPLLGRPFRLGPYPAPGASQLINNMQTLTGVQDFRVIAGPSTRRLIDLAQPEQSLTILPTGNSGHVRSPHFDDQVEMFLRGEYRSVRYTAQQIQDHARHFMRLHP